MLKITLCAYEQELYTQFVRFCEDLQNVGHVGAGGSPEFCVQICQANILTTNCDAVVSPANSFGFMDGGIDKLYTEHFGTHVQERLQLLIRREHFGELLVGRAEIVDTDHPTTAFLISAPTMRVPMILKDTVNPYLAVRATLLLIEHGYFPPGSDWMGEKISDHVKSVAFPGLGTGVGRVPPEVCAKQVCEAISSVYDPVFPATWHEAHCDHQRMYTGHIRNLQHA